MRVKNKTERGFSKVRDRPEALTYPFNSRLAAPIFKHVFSYTEVEPMNKTSVVYYNIPQSYRTCHYPIIHSRIRYPTFT